MDLNNRRKREKGDFEVTQSEKDKASIYLEIGGRTSRLSSKKVTMAACQGEVVWGRREYTYT